MTNNAPKRRLSLPRLILVILIIGFTCYFSVQWWKNAQASKDSQTFTPWSAAYVDVTAVPDFHFEKPEVVKAQKNIMLSFIVSSYKPCIPSWGKHYSIDEAANRLDLDRKIARFRQLGGDVSISFGGALNEELAVTCTDETKLKQSYQEVINHYGIDTIDLDLEGENLGNPEIAKRRYKALSEIQKDFKSRGQKLSVWLTLPVTPQGMTLAGTDEVFSALKNGVDLSGVNLMTMNFGQSKESGESMSSASIKALTESHRQISILYNNTGLPLDDKSVWTKMGATPMIGQNDLENEIFTLNDSKFLNEFMLGKTMPRLSFWSLNRDISCGQNYVNLKIASNSCSSVNQERFDFAKTLSKNFSGKMSQSPAPVTLLDTNSQREPDDPEKSPYQIWTKAGTYLEGTRVVWRHNVYQAKWWTRGDIPDNPTLDAWQTPWQIIGPVLPGDKPIPVPTLPKGTYPEWSGTKIYNGGDRVLFNGVPFQAKWWTQGDSPAKSNTDPDSSPWIALTENQLEEGF